MTPSAVAMRHAPSGRGAEPQTPITTARPTRRPDADKQSKSARRSRIDGVEKEGSEK
jgi:hypothetical protein